MFILGKVGVTVVAIEHVGNDDICDDWEEKSIDLFPSDDEDLLVDQGDLVELPGVMNCLNSVMVPGRIARYDNVLPLRKRTSDRIKGLAPHDDGVAGGVFLEELQVVRKTPGQISVFPDDTLGSHGNDGG